MLDQIQDLLAAAKKSNLTIELIELNYDTFDKIWKELKNEQYPSSAWSKSFPPFLDKFKLYGIDFSIDNNIRGLGALVVHYKPVAVPSWTVQVVNELTGDVIKAFKFNKQDAGDVTKVLLNVQLPGVKYQWDSWVTLP